MITIYDKADCCGCAACVQICPKHCIAFREDEQGFRYPSVDTNVCINCKRCEKTCPCLSPFPSADPTAFATHNKNEHIRQESSSGGIFSLMAEYIIENGGVVFGAKFDGQWEVVHAYTDKKEDLKAFRSSKYAQSRMGTAYIEAKRFLDSGRSVLFTGTPCQIAGLRHFLRKDYENLYCADIVCHSVPSPKVWREYLQGICKKSGIAFADIKRISFRDKRTGWENYSFVIESSKRTFQEYRDDNLFLRGFIQGLYNRPSCHKCPAKPFKSGSDLTLGDCWGASKFSSPIPNDNKGISLILANTEKGKRLLSLLNIDLHPLSLEEVGKYNPAIREYAVPSKDAARFWLSDKSIIKRLKMLSSKPRSLILKQKLYRLLH